MNQEEKVIRVKVGVLELAKQLGNVSQACRAMGYSRDSFYRFKEPYDKGGDNVLLLGPPGVGKSHLAVALGMKACAQGVRTLFVSATALITTLGKALAEGKLEERLKLLTQPQLLIIDEIGYLPIDRQGATLFFQLVSRRYERGSIVITSNQSLGAWGEVFGDAVIDSAILDRLLHHSITINMVGTQN